MGRKRKRKSSSLDLRTYEFRPRNGLGLFFPKKNCNNTSSIFQYNHRTLSPDSSFDNDEDLIDGILFTSFKELRGLENHSPLIIDSETSDEEYIEDSDLYQNSNIYENISLKILGSHCSMKSLGKPGRCFSQDSRFYSKRIKRLESSNYFTRPRINCESTFTQVSNFGSDFTDRNIPNSNDLSLEEVVQKLSDTQHEKLPTEDLESTYQPFLIKNLLNNNNNHENNTLARKFNSHVPIAGSNSNCNMDDVKFQSLNSSIETNDEITYLPSSIYSSHYHYPPCLPFFSSSKKLPSLDSIIPDKNDFFASNKYFENSSNIGSSKAGLSHTIINNFKPIFLQHDGSNELVSPTMQHSTLNITPHPCLPISRNIQLQDSFFPHISDSSLVLSQHKYYRVCMNHAYIAWSIFARETHLREEDSREKGLYPLSLHNKKCHNKPILRPKVIRELDGSRYKNDILNIFYGDDFSIESLSRCHLPCQLTRREISSTFRPSYSYSLTTPLSNEISAPSIPNSINNRKYTNSTSLSLYPSNILHNFLRNSSTYNTLASYEPLSIQSSLSNCSNYFPTFNRSTKYFHDQNLKFTSIIPRNLSKYLNPLLPSNIFLTNLENFYNTQLKSNLALYFQHCFQKKSF